MTVSRRRVCRLLVDCASERLLSATSRYGRCWPVRDGRLRRCYVRQRKYCGRCARIVLRPDPTRCRPSSLREAVVQTAPQRRRSKVKLSGAMPAAKAPKAYVLRLRDSTHLPAFLVRQSSYPFWLSRPNGGTCIHDGFARPFGSATSTSQRAASTRTCKQG